MICTFCDIHTKNKRIPVRRAMYRNTRELKYGTQGLVFFFAKMAAFTAMHGLRSLQWVVILFLDCRWLPMIKDVKGLLSKAPWQLFSVLSSGARVLDMLLSFFMMYRRFKQPSVL